MNGTGYYEVLAASPSFHGGEPLTYSSSESLLPGQIVTVPLRKARVAGMVVKKVQRPAFATKEILRVVSPQPLPTPTRQLFAWLQAYYPAPLGITIQQFLPSGLLQASKQPRDDTRSGNPAIEPLPPLTEQQQQAIGQLTSSSSLSAILHGATGTGKTRIYMELAQGVIAEGKSALILTPEIGLTPQLIKSFQRHFDCPVLAMHSNLTDRERRETFLHILESDTPVIVIGPRSSLFTPIPNLGLIVIDEAHESAYKQEQAPYYNALRVAGKLAQLHSARLIQGTATPLVAEYYLAASRDIPIVRLTKPAVTSTAQSSIELINLKEREKFSRSSHLSDRLIELVDQALTRGEQSLVFLNRRGTARLVMCQACGWQALCPACDVPLTYHGDSHSMQCHTCGYRASTTSHCPECKSTDIIFKSVGTKAIEQELQRVFPRARIQRFDTDNSKADRLEQHYEAIAGGDVDILVGTQMLAKGLDLPNLAVVGVVIADTSLYLPDYTADEKTYQMITQVTGRIGRGHRAGIAVIQTYNPRSPAIRAALNKDWTTFYDQQITEREQYLFPPFCHALKLACERSTQKGAQTAATKLATNLRAHKLNLQIIGPSPAFQEKVRDKYRQQILVKSKQRSELLKIIPLLPANWTYDLDPMTLL